MEKIKAVIFDLDGTFANTYHFVSAHPGNQFNHLSTTLFLMLKLLQHLGLNREKQSWHCHH